MDNGRVCVKMYNTKPPKLLALKPENFILNNDASPTPVNIRTINLGRTSLCTDTWTIILERVRIERQKSYARWSLMGCVVCGSHQNLAECCGCHLTQWCSDECRSTDLSAGHEKLCKTLQSLDTLYSPAIKEAGRKYLAGELNLHTLTPEGPALDVSAYPALTIIDKDPAPLARNSVVAIRASMITWPASIEIGQHGVPLKVQSDSDQQHKLTDCTRSHTHRYKSLGDSQLKMKHALVCGQYCLGGFSFGIASDVSHPEVLVSLKDLCRAKKRTSHCTEGCTKVDQPLDRLFGSTTATTGFTAAQKSLTISKCFYSFCFDRVVNDIGGPGSVEHCAACGVCRNYMYGHCDDCNKCSYGLTLGCIACQHCHDLLLTSEGLMLIPHSPFSCAGTEDTNNAGYLHCSCGNGRRYLFDRSKEQGIGPAPGALRHLPTTKPCPIDHAAAVGRVWNDIKGNAKRRVSFIGGILDRISDSWQPTELYREMADRLHDWEGSGMPTQESKHAHLAKFSKAIEAKFREEFEEQEMALGAEVQLAGLRSDALNGMIGLSLGRRVGSGRWQVKVDVEAGMAEQKTALSQSRTISPEQPGVGTRTVAVRPEHIHVRVGGSWVPLSSDESYCLWLHKELAIAKVALAKTDETAGTKAAKKRAKKRDARICDACGRLEDSEFTLKLCGSCGNAAFCDRVCQKKVWVQHKKVCNIIASSKKTLDSDVTTATCEYFYGMRDAAVML